MTFTRQELEEWEAENAEAEYFAHVDNDLPTATHDYPPDKEPF